MNSKKNTYKEANRLNSKMLIQSAPPPEDLKQSQPENDSDSDWESWETESLREWQRWNVPSESEWSFGGDTESGSDSGDEKMMPLCAVTSPSLQEWSHEIRLAKVCEFKLKPGPKESCGNSPVDFFKLLFQPSLFEFLVNNVNNHAIKAVNENPHIQRGRRYKEVTLNEFYVFFGLFLNFEYYGTDPIVEDLGEYISEARFKAILKFLNFDNTMPENHDKMSRISQMVDYFNMTMKQAVNPEKILIIEKSYEAPWREDFYLLQDQFGLLHKLYLCHEKERVGPREAKKLLEDKLDVGHSIYMNETFNSLELTKYLVDRNTHVTGPLKRKRLGKLRDVTRKQLQKGQKMTMYNADGICLTKWNRLGTVFVSTEHSAEWQDIYIKERKQKRNKPACVLEYKKIRESVVNFDELFDYYVECEEGTNKYKKMGLHILQMLLLNAYTLYDKYGGEPNNDPDDFRTAVIKHLVSYGKPVGV